VDVVKFTNILSSSEVLYTIFQITWCYDGALYMSSNIDGDARVEELIML